MKGFLRSLRPGRDQQLAADMSAQRRAGHRRSLRETAADGQAWEDADRARDQLGDRQTDWNR